MLFELLANVKNVWTIGDESHRVIESIKELSVRPGHLHNRLTGEHASPGVIGRLCDGFEQKLINREGIPYSRKQQGKVRFLEKTPKNSLRVSFLNKVFPDAYYIYLVRDPCEALSSMIDAWRSGKWVTYRNLSHWLPAWSMLLPPGWEGMQGRTIGDVVAFQWLSANTFILDDLSLVPDNRVLTITYNDIVSNTRDEVLRICEFCDLEYDGRLDESLSGDISLSKYTLSAPDINKWKRNFDEIFTVHKSLLPTLKRIQRYFDKDVSRANRSVIVKNRLERLSRNAVCLCGSGKKFKKCHGL